MRNGTPTIQIIQILNMIYFRKISTSFFYMQAVFATKSLEITNLMSANAFYILCQDRDIIDSRLCKLFPWHQNKIKMQMIKDATSH